MMSFLVYKFMQIVSRMGKISRKVEGSLKWGVWSQEILNGDRVKVW